MSLLSTCNSCSQSSQIAKVNRRLDAMDSTLQAKGTLDEIQRTVAIEGFKVSKRMLYDNNAIVRTQIRPDDQMNAYDKEIEKLEKQ